MASVVDDFLRGRQGMLPLRSLCVGLTLPSTRYLASLAAARNPWPKCGLGVQGFGHASTCAVGTFPTRAVVQLFFFAYCGQIPGKGGAMVC